MQIRKQLERGSKRAALSNLRSLQ